MKLPLGIFSSLLMFVPLTTYSAQPVDPVDMKRKLPPRTTLQTPGPATMIGRHGIRREPSGIYGWLVITDPNSGERWYPTDERGLPLGLISLWLQFHNLRDGHTEIVKVNTGNRNIFHADAERNAWRYAIRFDHDLSWEGAPSKVDHRTFKYSPKVWRFAGIQSPVHYKIFTTTNQTRELARQRIDWKTTYQQRRAKFADLPDIRP